VLAAGGTAPEASVPGYVLAGKTGTAEKPDLGLVDHHRVQAALLAAAGAR
jgi:cell division protein FtsI/penicillin-binding protein 2